jgi:hypothetical protein
VRSIQFEPEDWLACLFPVVDPVHHAYVWNNTGRITVQVSLLPLLPLLPLLLPLLPRWYSYVLTGRLTAIVTAVFHAVSPGPRGVDKRRVAAAGDGLRGGLQDAHHVPAGR